VIKPLENDPLGALVARMERTVPLTEPWAGLTLLDLPEGAYVLQAEAPALKAGLKPGKLLTAAGGRLTDSDGGALAYARSGLQNPRGVVASNGHVHQAALAAMARLRVLTRY